VFLQFIDIKEDFKACFAWPQNFKHSKLQTIFILLTLGGFKRGQFKHLTILANNDLSWVAICINKHINVGTFTH
jgi:hypothetical protein